MKGIRRFLMSLGTATIIFTMSAFTAFAYGDPPGESADTEVLPENPGDEQVREDDHTPLSYEGTGTVVDNILNGSKQFYTISTDEGNEFYLIIDLDKDYNNVYFLDTTKEGDLLALAEKAEGNEVKKVEEPEVPLAPAVEETPQEPVVEEKPAPKQDNSAIWVIFAIIVLGGAGVIFYYWIYKPKKDIEQAEEFEETFEFKDEDKGYDDAYEELTSYEE